MSREPKVMIAFRVSRDLRAAANTKADERGEVLSEVLRKALERYVAKK